MKISRRDIWPEIFNVFSFLGQKKIFFFFVITELEERQQPQLPRSSEELEDLQKLLHFPEEVALRLTETEYQLFYLVPPGDYLRHVEEEISTTVQKQQQECILQKTAFGGKQGGAGGIGAGYHHRNFSSSCSTLTNSATQTDDDKVTMQILISRHNEVNLFFPTNLLFTHLRLL